MRHCRPGHDTGGGGYSVALRSQSVLQAGQIIRWVADLEGDGADYDIASITSEGREGLIEVKTTRGWERTPFPLTRNELAAAEEWRSAWCLLRHWGFRGRPGRSSFPRPLRIMSA